MPLVTPRSVPARNRHAVFAQQLTRLAAPGSQRAADALAEFADAADAAGFADIAGHARLSLGPALHRRPRRWELLASTLTWLVTQLDRQASWIGWWEQYEILHQSTWLLTDGLRHPHVTLADLGTALARLERQTRQAGYADVAIARCGYLLDLHRFGHQGADASYQAWARMPRSEMSADAVEETELKVDHLAALGHDHEAVDLATPGMVLTHLPLAVLRLGMPEQAAGLMAHTLADAVSHRPGLAGLDWLTRQLTTCLRGGVIEVGLELLRWWLPLLRSADRADPLSRLDLLMAAHGVLAEATRQGLGGHTLPIHDGHHPAIGDVADWTGARARRLADRFDRRNQTGHHRRRLDQLLDDLPSASRPGTVLPLAGHRDGSPAPFLAARLTRRNEHPFAPPTDDLDGLDVVGLRDRLRQVQRWGGQANTADVLTFWQAHRDDLVAATVSPDASRAAVDLDYAACFAEYHPTHPKTVEAHAIAERYRRLGLPADARLVEQRVDIDALDIPAVLAAITPTDADGTRVQRLTVRLRLVGLSEAQSVLAGMTDEIEALVAAPPPLGADERSLAALRGTLPMMPDRAADVLDACLDTLQPGEWPAVRALLLARRALVRLQVANQREGALADQIAAEQTAGEAGELDALVGVLVQRARVVFDDDLAGSERDMLRARWAALQADALEGVAATSLMLVELLGHENRLDEAAYYLRDALAVLGDEALTTVPRRRHDLLQARAHLRRAGAHLMRRREMADLGHDDDDAEYLMRAAIDDLEGLPDERETLPLAHFELAELLTGNDALEALHEYDLADELARAEGTPRLRLVVARERIQATYIADGPDAALAALDAAQRLNDEFEARTWSDPGLQAQLEWDFDVETLQLTESRIRVLRAAQRTDAAMALASDLSQRYQVSEHPVAAVRAQILRAELLMDSGLRQDSLDEFRDASLGARRLGNTGLARFAALRGAQRLEEAGDTAAASAFWHSLMDDSPAA